MARIRSIKPDFWKSESIARLPMRTRLTFIALWSYVDDNGVGRDNEKLIAAELFALEDDPREAIEWVREDLAILAREGRVIRYTVADRHFLHVTNWSDHQKIDRPNKPRYPLPTDEGATPLTCDDASGLPSFDEDARGSREGSSPGAVDQGAGEQGTGETSAKAAAPIRSDVEGLCRYFAAAVAKNDVKATITEKWRTDARLLLDKDEKNPTEIRAVIDWATQDGFWRANILSVPKLREKYNQLRLAMQANQSRPATSQGVTLEQQRRRL
jgi:hypothetical protein